MKDYRIIFEKTGNLKYISHLDLNRCMLRSVRRSGLPAWYTEGFHPHLYLMFPLALPLGTESICEMMDIRLLEEITEQEILEKLNAVFPAGLRAVRVCEPDKQVITGAEYRIQLSSEELPDMASCWNDFLEQPEILVQKHAKKGKPAREMNIKPFLNVKEQHSEPGNLQLVLDLPAGSEKNINTSVVVHAFENYAGKRIFTDSVCRMKIFCRNYEEIS